MNYFKNIKIAAAAAALAIFSGCGGGGEDPLATPPLELESTKKALFFYGASTNDHFAFDTQTKELTELNSYVDDHNATNFKMDDNQSGWLFVWVDDKGDTNATNDEDKVIMFDAAYSFSEDGNATWEDFYYLGHYHEHAHEETEALDHEEHLELAAHTNEEFNDTNVSSSAYQAMLRLNSYLQTQEDLKAKLQTRLESLDATLEVANFYVSEMEAHEEEGVIHDEHEHTERFYVLATNGRLYVFDGHAHGDELHLAFKDETLVSSLGASARDSGISPTPDGVLVYLKNTATLYLVDSHEDERTHVHGSWDVVTLLGEGRAIDMMVGIKTVELEGEAHVH